MKKLIFLALIVMAFAACQKTKLKPGPSAIGKDTIPDNASFKLQMATDSTGSEYPSTDTLNVMVHFNHTYHTNYSWYNGEDGAANEDNAGWRFLALSNDGGQLVMDGVPYKPGVAIPIFTSSVGDSNHARHFILKVLNLKNIPDDIHIWCKDNYMKDSADLRKQPFRFFTHHNDTSSYGGNRFQIVTEPY
ncbi:MAG TPA: hypothetical protein VK668_11240 [Mucilaginibacter sp.]|nr:hypothetical protein [Mucilaginibacter sp.]